MESNFLTAVFLPLALFIIMLAMGLGLTIADFKRIATEPKAVAVGLFAQLVVLPIVGFFLASMFSLSPELAVGVVILAACPGGPTSNLITYLAKGNVALSITLTAISSTITVFTIPLVVNLSTSSFIRENVSLQLSFVETVAQISVVTIIPVVVGMLLHHYAPKFPSKVEKGVKWLSLFFLAFIVFGLLLKELNNVLEFFLQVGWVTLTLNVATMALGYAIATSFMLERRDVTAVTCEVGIQNGTLAITIASAPTLLNNPTMAIPAAIYALIMFATGGMFAVWKGQEKAMAQ